MPALSAYTPINIITLALKAVGVLGVGQSALSEDFNDAFDTLNMMLAQWSKKRWLVYHLVEFQKISTGAASYTVGPGGDYNVSSRPDRLEAAYLRQLVQAVPNQIDFPLLVIEARETYNEIALKQLTSFPSYCFYDPSWPLGTLYPWPIPQPAIYGVNITIKETLTQFPSLTTVVNLPPEYIPALYYNLAVRLAPAYSVDASKEVIGLAKDSLAVLRGANTQVPLLKLPETLVRAGVYNPYSDQIR